MLTSSQIAYRMPQKQIYNTSNRVNFKNYNNPQYAHSADPFENLQISAQSKQEKRAKLTTIAAVGTFAAFGVMALIQALTHKYNKRVALAQEEYFGSQINNITNTQNNIAKQPAFNLKTKLSTNVSNLLEDLLKNLYSGENANEEIVRSITQELDKKEPEIIKCVQELVADSKAGKKVNDELADKLLNTIFKINEPTLAEMEAGHRSSEQLKAMFTDVSKEKSFEELKLSKEMQQQLDAIVDRIKRAKDYDEYLQEVQNAIMFYGPPGTGKTTWVLALCKKLGVKPFIYNMGKLKGSYQGVVESNMDRASEVFMLEHKKARIKDPNSIDIMFFDECDEIFQKPKGGNENSDSQILTRFKNCFNKWKNEKGIYIFGNTNKSPEELESAMGDRMASVFIDRPNWKNLSDALFGHYEKGGAKIAANLKKPSRRSDEFFKILEKEEHEPSYRQLERIAWTGIKIPENGEPLSLNDIIKHTIEKEIELKLSKEEIKELTNLIQ